MRLLDMAGADFALAKREKEGERKTGRGPKCRPTLATAQAPCVLLSRKVFRGNVSQEER